MLIGVCTYALPLMALEEELLPDVKDGIVSLQIAEPQRNVGYTVGDILTRKISIQVKRPFILVEESLPIVGYERRYKGQLIGIDLVNLSHEKKESGDYNQHNIRLSYQVFTNNVVAKPAALPAEYLRLIDTSSKEKTVYRYRIPSWNFSISPIAVFGQVKVEREMSGYRGPLLLQDANEQLRLKLMLSVLGVSLIALLYILGTSAWLPRMGGPFAVAYKRIKKSGHNDAGVKSAIEALHIALNKSAGYSLFSNNLQPFLSSKTSFRHIEPELAQFFAISRNVFFDSKQTIDASNTIKWLSTFCKQCRACERGLIPDSLKTQAKAV
jgi:mxaA protein